MFFDKNKFASELDSFSPDHIIAQPDHWRAGVVFASPHSGSIYPEALIKHAKLSAHQLRRNEDIYIDHLFHSASAAGAPLLRAIFPRVMVDVNRAPDELPPIWADDLAQPTPRAAAGLGVVPTYVSESQAIYATLPSRAQVRTRIERLYHPYHAALQGLISAASARFGQCLLVDCHSMPGFAPMGSRRPDVILGDRFGSACHPDTLAHVQDCFIRAGYNVGVNYPYAGGFVTTHYGQPQDGVEAIQIEINRDLYVNPVTLSPKSGYVTLAENLRGIIAEIIEARTPQAIAAQ